MKTEKKIPERSRSFLGRFYCINDVNSDVPYAKVRTCVDAMWFHILSARHQVECRLYNLSPIRF